MAILGMLVLQLNAQGFIDATGTFIEAPPAQTSNAGASRVDCANNNGVMITTTGSGSSAYSTPNTTPVCATPPAPFTGVGLWTTASSTGTLTYTFSPAVSCVAISYSAVNGPNGSGLDVGRISVNGGGTLTLSNACGATILGNQLTCNLTGGTNPFGDVNVTVSSTVPFTTITLTNVGGQSGWVQGDPCAFIIDACAPVCSDTCFWKVTGNNIIGNNNIFGTLTNDDVRIFTNNTSRGIITSAGRFGIGTSAPTAQLHTTRDVRFEGITPNNLLTRVMVQDNSGNVFWRNASTLGSIINADQGLTIDGGNTAVLGSRCGDNLGLFKTDREVNMNDFNLYFDGGGEGQDRADGKIYMGQTALNPCKQLEARLEISTRLQTNNPVNDYASPQPSTSGLRFTDLTALSPVITNESEGVLSLDKDGDVIWVKRDGGGNVNSTCTSKGFVPRVTAAGSPNLSCSQIFDDGVGVGIASTGPFGYVLGSPPFSGGSPPVTGTLKLDVNGVARFSSLFATSDRSLKTNIAEISDANSLITRLQGKTYNWTEEYANEAKLDKGMHYGFIAQEVEEVIPEAVIIDENGKYAVNYNAILPVLVESQKLLIQENESLKNEINDLKADIAEIKEMMIADRAYDEGPKAKLYQNFPNPFEQKTMIKYYVPECAGNCEVVIYSIQGVEVYRHAISEKGEGQFEFDISSLLASQYYVYSLFENGKLVDSKKMLIQERN